MTTAGGSGSSGQARRGPVDPPEGATEDAADPAVPLCVGGGGREERAC
ncbi:MAG: hypothetical protein ACRENE_25775 [Polyangiaceae bacterium]